MTRVPMSRPRVLYLVPDHDRSSWGIALLHRHVAILRRNGVAAWALHHRPGFVPHWIESPAPILYLEDESFDLAPDDVVVVPEVLAHEGTRLDCRRIVFVQGAFLILAPFETSISYPELGYSGAIAILPHVQEILARHFATEASVVPPFIAEYFFTRGESGRPRRRRILLFPKEGYREAGYHDMEILRKLLGRNVARRTEWEVLEVTNRSHREVARLMQESEFMVNLNCLEAFNTTVPEAMAAGCLPICYEGYGGRDFLKDGTNAFVFANNEVFGLAAAIEDIVARFDDRQEEFRRMRRAARRTALRFTEEATEAALLSFFRSFGLF